VRSATSSKGRTLLVLHPPGEPPSGVGRVYVEYRDRRGWDRGLDVFGADLAQVGVVVHSVEGTAAGPLVWYRGSIVAGAVDTDLAIAGRWSSRWTASSTSTVDRVRSRSPIGRQRPCP
jgi:hypothetical protein